MKTSSAAVNSEASAVEIAQGCLTTNLAVPGLGSVLGKRKVGYLQMVVCFTGQILTLIFGIHFISWSLAHWGEIHQASPDDPFAPLRAMWIHLRWALLGILLYGVAVLWALQTGYAILREAKNRSSVQ